MFKALYQNIQTLSKISQNIEKRLTILLYDYIIKDRFICLSAKNTVRIKNLEGLMILRMANIKAFKGLRYTKNAGKIKTLTCPPYDIISEDERLSFLDENEYNIIRLELPKGDEPYKTAGKTLNNWLENEILKQDPNECIYIYEEKFTINGQTKSIKGIIANVRLEEFEKGIILPHEFTLSKAKTDRFNLMEATGCNFSQIYSLYSDEQKTASALIEKASSGSPEVIMEDKSGIVHSLWAVSDVQTITALTACFDDKKLYIADGHHRYETALNYRNTCRQNKKCCEVGNADYVMMMLVDMAHEGLLVLPTHRLVRDLETFDEEALLKGAQKYFEITQKTGVENIEQELELFYEKNEKAFGLYTGGDTWTQLVLKDHDILKKLLPDMSSASRGLDVTVLHTLILEGILGIDKENMANQVNLTYVKQFSDAVESVKNKTSRCAFILNPTRVSEIRDVAAAGEKMPQKSTYFYPKLITGLVMNKLL